MKEIQRDEAAGTPSAIPLERTTGWSVIIQTDPKGPGINGARILHLDQQRQGDRAGRAGQDGRRQRPQPAETQVHVGQGRERAGVGGKVLAEDGDLSCFRIEQVAVETDAGPWVPQLIVEAIPGPTLHQPVAIAGIAQLRVGHRSHPVEGGGHEAVDPVWGESVRQRASERHIR